MAEQQPSSIARSVSTGKLLAFVRRVDGRKMPLHTRAVHEALLERERRKAA